MNEQHIENLTMYSSETSHQASVHAEHASHELPNLLTLLSKKFPDSSCLAFLHQWENVFFSLLTALVICSVFIYAVRKKSLIPDGIQNFCEGLVEVFESFVTGILGPSGRKHVPYVGTVFVYILFMNWLGLIPLMKSPTSAWSTTVALALATMVYIQYTGIREQGFFNYLKHLAGNPSNLMGFLLIPLMFAIDLIIEIGAVPFSLSLRLFANVSSEDRLLLNFAEMAVTSKFLTFPFQLFANILAIIFSLIQAFVFTLLTTVYIALVSPHEDHGPVQGEDVLPAH